MIYIKQYGAKRTGTNYLKWLMESNFQNITVLSNILGWKHGLHPDKVDWSGNEWDHRRPQNSKKLVKLITEDLRDSYNNGDIRYSVIIKNPYSYYVSHLRLWPKNSTDQRIVDCITTWNDSYNNWYNLSQSSQLTRVTKFEDLIKNKKIELNKIANKFELRRITKLVDTRKSLRALNEITKGQKKFKRKKTFDPSFYLNKKYMSFISSRALQVINKHLDKTLMDIFSYEVE